MRRNTVRRSCAVVAVTVLTAVVMNIVVFDSLTVLQVGYRALKGLRGSAFACSRIIRGNIHGSQVLRCKP